MSLYLGDQIISGAYLDPSRKIGQIITSTLPLTDAGLHLLDGALINGGGSYGAFVDYIADVYNNADTHIVDNVRNIGKVTISDHVASGFSLSPLKYLQLYNYFNPASTDTWENVVDFTTGSDVSTEQIIYVDGEMSSPNYYGLTLVMYSSKIRIWIGKGNAANNYAEVVSLSAPVANTHYKAKVTCDGAGTYSFYLKSDSDADFVLQGSVSNITMAFDDTHTHSYIPMLGLFYSAGGHYHPFLGSVDLSGCYIKVNDSTWWTGVVQHKVGFATEEYWQEIVSTYGECGKFVYDSTNSTVRLPKITGIIEGTNDVITLGDLVEAGLPSIEHTHNYTLRAFTQAGYAGSNRYSYSGNDTVQTSVNSSVSPIYGNSDTVQPQTIKVLYYIVIATLTKTDIEVDIDEIATDLNGKAEVNLSNISSTTAVPNIDGQWISSELAIASSVTAPSSTDLSYSLATYLPDDGYTYEVLFTMSGTTATSANSYNVGRLYSDIINSSVYIFYNRNPQGNTVATTSDGNVILPIGQDRKVYIHYYSGNTGVVSLSACGYRRVGTNQ